MQAVETFFDVKKVQPEQDYKPATAEEAAELEELKLLREGAKTCGLEQMNIIADDRIRSLMQMSRTKRLGMRELSVGERVLWCAWLPTAYSTLLDPLRRDQIAWKGYTFDMVPVRVLDIIKVAREQKLFTELEIRTPEKEKAKIDPALFGRIGETWYLLARWAESDEHLLPLKELHHAVRTQILQEAVTPVVGVVTYILVALVVSVIAGAVYAIPQKNQVDWMQHFSVGAGAFASILISLILFFAIKSRTKLALAKKAHPIAARAVAARLKS